MGDCQSSNGITNTVLNWNNCKTKGTQTKHIAKCSASTIYTSPHVFLTKQLMTRALSMDNCTKCMNHENMHFVGITRIMNEPPIHRQIHVPNPILRSSPSIRCRYYQLEGQYFYGSLLALSHCFSSKSFMI
jgi:hypothetical protein